MCTWWVYTRVYLSGCVHGVYTRVYLSGCVQGCIPRCTSQGVYSGVYQGVPLRVYSGVYQGVPLRVYPSVQSGPLSSWCSPFCAEWSSLLPIPVSLLADVPVLAIPVSLLVVVPGPTARPTTRFTVGLRLMPITRFTVGRCLCPHHPFHCWSVLTVPPTQGRLTLHNVLKAENTAPTKPLGH